MCPPPQIASLPAPKKEQRNPPEDPGSGSYRLIRWGVEDAAEGWGERWREQCPHRAQRYGHAGEGGGDPVSVQGVRGASSHIRTLNKSHGFSGATRPGRGAPTGSQVCVVVGTVSGLSCVSG